MQTNPLSNTASEAELKNLSPEEIALLTLWLNQIVVGEFRKFFVHMYFQYLVHCSDDLLPAEYNDVIYTIEMLAKLSD
uniref:hypothetical protein n=1 Tax=Roseivirga sp. TaxID=1964215 RepID=UPI00404836B6